MSNINKIKRGLIIVCIVLLIGLVAFILIRNTANMIIRNQQEKDYDKIVENIKQYKSHTSYDGVFSIKAPNTWSEVKNKNSLNANAVIELKNEIRNAYLVAVVTNKLDVTDTFEIFKSDVFNQKQTHYGITISEYKDVVIDGKNAQYIEFYNTNEDSINTYIRSYAIETKNYYVQIMIWTLKSNENLVQQEFNNIMNTFKEI
jgi:hypothetical protein